MPWKPRIYALMHLPVSVIQILHAICLFNELFYEGYGTTWRGMWRMIILVVGGTAFGLLIKTRRPNDCDG